ncbi:hypothetical protein BGW36DRAFT_169494 [Talaromyces proteolyticus]|uniref:Maltose/galactoside acetyltransferase domain-containing protein n=1 Tax=Talaromyces proteolyticus TaxID=1131652 RepID=A0AAD4Q0E5_9EURO|nr:uncharacterized protein BGW36DRAFT_169494 [Talaromyces proteolyticus]KAH8697562.1 hypothetical protein BGW36DRAFT_169494 [Talaromyces proteolyticus]
MYTTAMGKSSLHKLAMWFRRLYSRKSGSASHANTTAVGTSPKQASMISCDAEVAHYSHHTRLIFKPWRTKGSPCHSYTASIPRTGVPTSEEYNKMVSGVPYKTSCPQLRAKKIEVRQFCAKYNVDDQVVADQTGSRYELWQNMREEREKMLRTIIGSVGEAPLLDPPFNFSYGCNIVLGDKVYANVKSVSSCSS